MTKKTQAFNLQLSKEPSYIASIKVYKNFALPLYFCKNLPIPEQEACSGSFLRLDEEARR